MSAQGIGYPDWQGEARWASNPFLGVASTALAGIYTSAVMYVGAWERTQFFVNPHVFTKRWRVTLFWSSDPAGANILAARIYDTVDATQIIDAPANLAPYLQITIEASDYIGNPTVGFQFTARNGAPGMNALGFQGMLIEQPAGVIGAGGIITVRPAYTIPRPSLVQVSWTTKVWLAVIYAPDFTGALHEVVRLTGDGIRTSDNVMFYAPTNQIQLVMNNLDTVAQNALGSVTVQMDT